MKNFLVLTRRELLSVFVSPLAYGTAAVFLFIFGLSFVVRFTGSKLVEVRTLLDPMGFMLPVLIAPVLTMRLLAEERRQGTLEMLVTAPVRDAEIVCGKFAGVWIFYALVTALTGVHVGTMRFFYQGPVDWGSFASGYLGMLLVAGLCLSFGLFVSSLFESPLLSALVSFAGGLTILSANMILSLPVFAKQPKNQEILEFLLPYKHYKGFLDGLIDTGDLAYFILTSLFFLFLSTKALGARKWS